MKAIELTFEEEASTEPKSDPSSSLPFKQVIKLSKSHDTF